MTCFYDTPEAQKMTEVNVCLQYWATVTVFCQSLNSLFGFGKTPCISCSGYKSLQTGSWHVFAKAVFQSADVWVTLVIYVSSSRQVSAENYAFCCSCQDMCCIRKRLFPTVLFSRSHDCDAVHFWEVSPCLRVPLNCTGWLFIANWSKRKRKNWLDIRPWNCVRKSAESVVFVSSSVFHSLNQRLLIWPLMTSRSVTSCVKVLWFINPPRS